MKLFLFVLLIIFNIQTNIKADNIDEIEIEGLSVGSSLLNHFSKDEIEIFKENSTKYKQNKFEVIFVEKKLNNYDRLQVTIKPNDQNYIIYSINGILDFENNIDECKKKSLQILSDIEAVIKNYEKFTDKGKHDGDPSGETQSDSTWLLFDNGGYIGVSCDDYGPTALEKYGWTDELSIDVTSEEFANFIQNEAYN